MATTRSTKITFEKRELTLISLPRGAKFVCSKCRAEIEHVAIARDANSIAVPVESERIDSTETAENVFEDKRKMEEG